MNTFMIYGAAGYTGSMAAEHAASAGLNLVLAGREKNRTKLEALADRLGAAVRLFSLDEPDATLTSLSGISVLLNAAGPFANTAEPLMSAAIRAGVHYLDFSAELDTYREALALDGQARAASVMLLPGSGGSVAMLGSLAGHAVARVKTRGRSASRSTLQARCRGDQPSARARISRRRHFSSLTVNLSRANRMRFAISISATGRCRLSL